MKRRIFFIIIIFIAFICYGQTKIGKTNNENILEIYKYNNSIIYTYVEESEGLISILQDYYCNINGKKYGPFSKQPVIKTTKNHYYIDVIKDDKLGLILDDIFFGFYDDLEDLIFTDDESKYCFRYSQNNEYYLFENGKTIVNKPYIMENTYSPDNKLYYGYVDILDEDYPEIYIKTPNNTFGPYTDIDEFDFNENNEFNIKVEIDDYDDYYLCNGILYELDEFKQKRIELNFSDYKKDLDGLYYQEGNQRTLSYDDIHFASLTRYTSSEITVLEATKNNNTYLIKDITKVYGPYPKESITSCRLSPETNELFYNTYINGEYTFYREGTKIATSTELIFPYFSENGKVFCFKLKTNDKKYWLSTGKEKIGPYDSITDITFSLDGTKIVYVGQINKEKYIYEGTKKIGPYSNVYDIELSNDNKLAFSYEDYDDNLFSNRQFSCIFPK